MPVTSSPLRNRLPLVAAWLTAAVGVVNVLSAITPSVHERMHLLTAMAPDGMPAWAHVLAVPLGVALLVQARALALRRRRALVLSIWLLAALGALNLLKGLDVEEALLSWALAGLLFWGRAAFYVRSEVGTLAAALRGAAIVAGATVATALLAVLAAAHWATPHGGLVFDVREALGLLTLTGGPMRLTGPFEFLPWALGILGVGALIAIAAILFRPLRGSHAQCPVEHDEACALVREHGTDTLSYFKLRRDLSHLWSADRRAFLAYRVEHGVLVVSGDPVGAPGAIPELLRDALAFADLHGLQIAVVGASAGFAETCSTRGLRSFYLGDEAVVETGDFTLEGKKIKKVRQACHRLKKSGYGCELRELGSLSADELAALDTVTDRWRDGEPERGFSMAMEGLHGDHLADTLVVIARDAEGTPRGFLHFVPAFGRPALSLSAMRRDPDTPNGIVDYMIVQSIELARERGIDELSLNFAAFAKWLHSPETALERLAGRALAILNPWFQIESLYSFNAKFFPRWEPRYLLHQGAMSLPRATVAALQAEGQLPVRMPAPVRRAVRALG